MKFFDTLFEFVQTDLKYKFEGMEDAAENLKIAHERELFEIHARHSEELETLQRAHENMMETQ